MRWAPLEVNLLNGMAALATAPGKRFLIGPAGGDGRAAVAALLGREARAFNEVELDVAKRHLRQIEERLTKLAEDFEYDRAGRGTPSYLPGAGTTIERMVRLRADVDKYAHALAALEQREQELVDAALAAFELRSRAELEAIKASGDEGVVVELLGDGWSLAGSRAERLSQRRELLGLPADADWNEAG
ncbi:MAG: hypothetical protein JXR83_03845 [Deltaproteobacteria bacterium]|nr:hypothetical protein [Deltaproteobacteria bacterium]